MLNLNLLSLPVVLVLCALVTGSLAYLSAQFDNKWHWKRVPVVLAASLILVYIGRQAIIHVTNSPAELPPHFMLIETPLAVGVCLTVMFTVDSLLALRKKEEQATISPTPMVDPVVSTLPFSKLSYLMTAVLVVSSLLFGLSLINRYYRYYPTLGSVFGQVSAAALGNQKNQPTQQTDKPGQIHAPLTTIQGSLENSQQQDVGKVFSVDIPGKVSGFAARSAWVYEPPIALTNANIALPVIVLMPGEPGKVSDWLVGGGAADTANAFAKTHDGIAPLIVMVDDDGSVLNDTECVNSQWGNVETYLTTDVPRFVKSHFTVASDPSQWAIGGLSMGGTCSIMLALDHPETYHYFMDLGGEIGPEIGTKQYTIDKLFNGNEEAWNNHQPSLLLQRRGAAQKYKGMGGFFAAGDDDVPLVTDANSQLYTQAKKDGLDVVSKTISGRHGFGVWKQGFSDALPWLSNRLGATVCQTSCQADSGATVQN